MEATYNRSTLKCVNPVQKNVCKQDACIGFGFSSNRLAQLVVEYLFNNEIQVKYEL